MNSRPAIPEPVKRALRQEAGFGCCKCGYPVYDYQHIIPYEREHHFRVEDMMLLCPNHHREATVGAMTEAEQRAYKSDPYNIRRGLADGALKVNQRELIVQLGNAFMVNDSVLLEIDGLPLLSLSLSDEGILQLSASLYNQEGELLTEIEHNEWIVGDPLPWDFEFGSRKLTLRERSRHISLQIDARNFPTSIRGHFWYGGHRFVINRSGILIDEERAHFARAGFAKLGLVGMRISLSTADKGISVRPHGRFGRGALVSQPTNVERMSESLKAWQNLKYPNLILKNRGTA
jgi:hypothetical protein